MKQKILNFITVIMIIATLTFSNFLLLGVNAVSYAADAISIVKKTNNKNVEFGAYFKNNNGDSVTNIDANTNSDSLVLYFKVAVKQEGYFDGKITLRTANFNLKSNILSDAVNKIEDNVIYLNQINAGEEKEIQVGIELKRDEQFDLNLINLESVASIEGIYRDQKEKDISIKADRSVTLNFINTEDTAILTQEVVTNKVFSYNGEEKRIIQLEIKSGLKDDAFPLRKSSIQIQTPKISDKYPEKVLVNSYNKLVTNGKELIDDNWNYDETTGMLNIEIENKEDNNIVSWLKDGQDDFIITYVFDKDVEIKEEKLNVQSEIFVYDLKNTKIESRNEITLTQEEKNSILKSNIKQNENDIYKGKLYSVIDRKISYSDFINVNLTGVTNQFVVAEKQQKVNGKEINSYYNKSIINKKDIRKILDESGSINITNAITGDLIKTIDINSDCDDNGDIVVTYPENITEIAITINNTKNEGIIELKSEKVIKNNNKTVFINANEITWNIENSYNLNEENIKLEDVNTKINLLETETSADLILEKTDISTMTKNSIEMKVVLNSREEKNELYKNPVIRVQLPSKIEKINVTSINLLYEDELKISSAKLLDGNIIEIKLQGEQTKYKDEAIDGATIIINAEIETSKKLISSEEKVVMTYTNQKAINYINGASNGEVTKTLNIVSYMGLVTINKIPDYQVEVVNNEGNKTADVQLSEGNKEVEVQNEVINNEEKQIENVKILGDFPTKDAKIENNMETFIVDGLNIGGIDTARAKVYYSNNEKATIDLDSEENKWSENITDASLVKKYLVVVDKLDSTESIDLNYKIRLPENLEYNLNTNQSYVVYYNNQGAEQKVETEKLELRTPKGAVIEAQMNTFVAGKEASEVKENGILRYEINLENTGSEDVSNVVVKATIPEGTTYVDREKLYTDYEVDLDGMFDKNKKEVEITVDKIAQGQKITKIIEVKVDDNMAGKQIVNKANIQYGEVQKETNTVTTNVKEGKLETKLVSVDSSDGILESGYQYRFILYITNHSDKDLKNLETTLSTSDIIKIYELSYINSESKLKVEDSNKIQIDKISAGETVELGISIGIDLYKTNETKSIYINATCTENNNEYYSNQIDLIAKSNFAYSMITTSENIGGYVSAGDTIKYNVTVKNEGSETSKFITLNNWLSNDVTLTKVMRNGVELSKDNYSLTIDSEKNKKVLKITENGLEAGKTVEYTIEVVVNLLRGNKTAVEIIYENSLNVAAFEIANSRIEHILQPEKVPSSDDNNDNNDDNGNNGNDNNQEQNYKIISGTAWIDENENGQKDSNEKLLEGITVKLLNVESNEFVKDSNGNEMTATTNSTGFYCFTKVTKGQYLVIFEYDTTKYLLAAYKKEGVTDANNSDVVSKTLTIDGQGKTVAATEIIKVEDSNIANINLGLINAKTYDLKLDKYISKVVIQNDKTVTKEYDNATLVKEEINSKQLNNTTVVVEYTIRVTNNGDVTAYVKKIADYLSSDYKFNSELNSDWYQSGNDIYCTSLANEKLEPGKSKDIKLTVIKVMTDNNTGLINNMAEIVESYNEYGLKDINSTEGNKVKGEDDMGAADLILSIKTGQIMATVFITITIIALIGIGIFIIIRKQILNKKVI